MHAQKNCIIVQLFFPAVNVSTKKLYRRINFLQQMRVPGFAVLANTFFFCFFGLAFTKKNLHNGTISFGTLCVRVEYLSWCSTLQRSALVVSTPQDLCTAHNLARTARSSWALGPHGYLEPSIRALHNPRPQNFEGTACCSSITFEPGGKSRIAQVGGLLTHTFRMARATSLSAHWGERRSERLAHPGGGGGCTAAGLADV